MNTPPPIASPPISNMQAPPAVLGQPSSSDKLWSVVSHLSAIIGIGYFILPLIVYLVMKSDSPYVAENAKEALNFHISLFIYWICCIPLIFVVIGIPLAAMIGLAAFILAIVAAIKAADGQCYRYPLTLRII